MGQLHNERPPVKGFSVFREAVDRLFSHLAHKIFVSIDLNSNGLIDLDDARIFRLSTSKCEREGSSKHPKFGRLCLELVKALEDVIQSKFAGLGITKQEFYNSTVAQLRTCLATADADYHCEERDYNTNTASNVVQALRKAQQERSETSARVFYLWHQIGVLSRVQAVMYPLIVPFWVIHLAVKKEHFYTILPACLYAAGNANFIASLTMTLACMTTGFITGFAKHLWRSPRPHWVLGSSGSLRRVAGVTESTFATPSAHSSVLTCIAVCAFWHMPAHAFIPTVFASWLLVASSRMYFGVHYVQDVLIGGAIGATCGVIFMSWQPLAIFSQGKGEQEAQNTLIWILLCSCMAFVLFSEIISRCVIRMPTPDLLEYWRVQMGTKHPIDPESTRKTWYAWGFTTGLLCGLHHYTLSGLHQNTCLWQVERLPGMIWLLAIPCNKYLVISVEHAKKYFLKLKLTRLQAEQRQHASAIDRFRGYIWIDLACNAVETLMYGFIAYWTIFLFPLFIQWCLQTHDDPCMHFPLDFRPHFLQLLWSALCVIFVVVVVACTRQQELRFQEHLFKQRLDDCSNISCDAVSGDGAEQSNEVQAV